MHTYHGKPVSGSPGGSAAVSARLDAEVLALLRKVSGGVILPHYRALADHQIETKAPDDFVTVADRLAEEMLNEGLARVVPGLALVGEEAAHADPTVMDGLARDCWIIDPIDGTANFASGEGPFAIMIALASGGEARSAWIYDPVRERLLTAHLGAGAYCDGEPVAARASGTTPPNLSAMTRFMAPDQRALFEAEIAPHYTQVKPPGCAAEEYPLTAFGHHDLCIYERTLAWDHAAGCLFLNEAGGKCARQDGTPYRVDSDRKGMIGAASPRLWDEFVARLDKSGYRPGG